LSAKPAVSLQANSGFRFFRDTFETTNHWIAGGAAKWEGRGWQGLYLRALAFWIPVAASRLIFSFAGIDHMYRVTSVAVLS
jgi:hypothetical protein